MKILDKILIFVCKFLAPALLAEPGALEVVSVSEAVSESVSECVVNFLLSKRPSL